MSLSPPDVVLFAALIVASVTDWRTGKIPNVLTFPLLAVGLAMQATIGQGLVFGLLGFAVGFAIHFPLWLLQVQKGGDAKLMIATGAFVGWAGIIEVTLATFVLFLPVYIGLLAMRGELANVSRVLNDLYSRYVLGNRDAEEAPPTYAIMGPMLLVGVTIAKTTDVFDLVKMLS